VEVILRAGPIPQADDDVALRALRPGRLRLGQLARGDAVRPIGVERQRPLRVEPADIRRHLRHRLAGLDAPLPRLDRGREGAELLRDRAGGPVAERMTAVAAVRLHDVEPLRLRLQMGRHAALRSSFRELARRRDLQHRVPVDRRVIFRRRGLVRRDHRIQIENRPGLRSRFRRVDEPVAANPDAVRRLRQIGEDVTAALVGDDDLRELGRQVGGLGDDPDAGFGAVRARDDAGEIVRAGCRRGADRLRRRTMCQGCEER
jgi:hypothetical protein